MPDPLEAPFKGLLLITEAARGGDCGAMIYLAEINYIGFGNNPQPLISTHKTSTGGNDDKLSQQMDAMTLDDCLSSQKTGVLLQGGLPFRSHLSLVNTTSGSRTMTVQRVISTR
ncbi:unnamed protein product [Protopolystoma xenopodis]|uniref:Uncharacterized protein n=1 Tax=Protopolystoma xenopodis TaxID=117903 RepID=A0A3S5FG26_9PLAT|nr:unnamed protein product [Protopolystoma xenopodis]